jgi:hypothetical protein
MSAAPAGALTKIAAGVTPGHAAIAQLSDSLTKTRSCNVSGSLTPVERATQSGLELFIGVIFDRRISTPDCGAGAVKSPLQDL